jgi:HSP20 family molecular chaperone IbpA
MAMEMWRTRPGAVSTLRNAFDRLWDEALSSPAGSEASTPGFQSLPVNVWETSEGYQAAMLAPGLDEQSINVTVQDESLMVEGELRVQAPEGARIVWQEFGPGRFRRSLRLGSGIDPSKVEAIYKNGLLLLTMPKAEHARPRQIQVQVSTADGKK